MEITKNGNNKKDNIWLRDFISHVLTADGVEIKLAYRFHITKRNDFLRSMAFRIFIIELRKC